MITFEQIRVLQLPTVFSKKTDNSPGSVPGSSFDNKLVSKSTCAQINFHREQALLSNKSASHPKNMTS